MKKVKLHIEGMHCASCAENIKKCLKSLKGIKEVFVNIITKEVTVETDNSISEEKLKKEVFKAGYKII